MTFGRQLIAASLCFLSVTIVSAQEARKDHSTREQTPFAPGVVTVIPSAPLAEETFDGPQTCLLYTSDAADDSV